MPSLAMQTRPRSPVAGSSGNKPDPVVWYRGVLKESFMEMRASEVVIFRRSDSGTLSGPTWIVISNESKKLAQWSEAFAGRFCKKMIQVDKREGTNRIISTKHPERKKYVRRWNTIETYLRSRKSSAPDYK